MQPYIAVTVEEFLYRGEQWTPRAYGQCHTYTDAVIHAGGLPILMPVTDDETTLRCLYDLCGGLVLSGGYDLDPGVYSAEASHFTKEVSPKRDKQELQLLKWALADDKPVLGICRGMQLINVALGGSLHQHIADDVPEADNHQLSEHNQDFKYIAHRLQIKEGSRLATILDTNQIDTNALHHQAIKRLGAGLVATAHAEDGIIEALELPGKRFVIGVQSHPEALEAVAEPRWQRLFAAFIDCAAASPKRKPGSKPLPRPAPKPSSAARR